MLKQFFPAVAKRTNQSCASITNHVAASQVDVTQHSHDPGANDEMFNKCEHVAIWLNDQKYNEFQLCNRCTRTNKKLQNPKLSPANEEPLER